MKDFKREFVLKITVLILTIGSFSSAFCQVWEPVGSEGFYPGNYPCLALDDITGDLFVAIQGDGFVPVVQKFENNNWFDVGYSGFASGSVYVRSLVVLDGLPYLAYSDANNGGKATVVKYDGTNWVIVGGTGFSQGAASAIQLVKFEDELYSSYLDVANGGNTTVKKFTGNTWETLGSVGFVDGGGDSQTLEIDAGIPYIAFKDESNSNKVSVMKFLDGSWQYVGNGGFSEGAALYHVGLRFINGAPYVAYRDSNQLGAASVMSFNGTNWEYVGDSGFTSDSASFVDLEVYNNQPYVVYQGASHTNVMRFNGIDWNHHGNNNFSQSTGVYSSLVINEEGTAYVAYKDFGFEGTITVMSYNADPNSLVELDLKDSIVSVFPNPAVGQIHIESSDLVKLVQIFSLDGKMVYSGEETVIPVDYLSGMYLLKVQTISSYTQHKVLVKY